MTWSSDFLQLTKEVGVRVRLVDVSIDLALESDARTSRTHDIVVWVDKSDIFLDFSFDGGDF